MMIAVNLYFKITIFNTNLFVNVVPEKLSDTITSNIHRGI